MAYDHTLENGERGASFNGTSGNDSMANHAGDVYISAGAGDDYIYNLIYYYARHTVQGAWHSYENIYGGYYEYNYIDGYVTVNGGKGNDTINILEDNEVYIQYTNGDGDDVLIGNDSNRRRFSLHKVCRRQRSSYPRRARLDQSKRRRL